MKNSIVLIPALVLPLLAGEALAAEGRQVELKVGEQRVFTVPGLTKVSVGSGGAADVRPSGDNQFILFANKEGRTSLVVFRRKRRAENWDVRVVSAMVDRFKTTCADLLGPDGCTGLRVAQIGGKLILTGRVEDLETYHRVRKLHKAFPDLVLMVEVEPVVLDALVAAVNGEFGRLGLPGASLSRVGGRLLLEGTVSDEMEKRKAQAVVDAMVDAALGTD